MADQTTVLQLVLNELGVANNISTQDERIAIQKLVCLTQEAGLQMGYGFNWYVRGPYSPSLTSDYYQIASTRETVETDATKFVLLQSAKDAVGKVAMVKEVPAAVALPDVLWLELVASVAFLMRKYRYGVEAAREKIQNTKPALAPYFDVGHQRLLEVGILE